MHNVLKFVQSESLIQVKRQKKNSQKKCKQS